MTSTKYIGIDVHKESISINSVGKIVMESDIETKASMILQFIDGCVEICRARALKKERRPPTKVVVCDPRKNKSMREGNQNDKIDAAHQLAERSKYFSSQGLD
jgi:hypothetical protein